MAPDTNPSDQAAILQGLAQDGAVKVSQDDGTIEEPNGAQSNSDLDSLFEDDGEDADEQEAYTITGLTRDHEIDSFQGAQSNLELGSLDYLFEDEQAEEQEAYPITELNRDQEVDSFAQTHAALLGNFADCKRPSTLTLPTKPRAEAVNNDFETLLQAVATAGESEAAHQVNENTQSCNQTSTYEFFKRTFRPPGPMKRKRKAIEVEESEDDSDMIIRGPLRKQRKPNSAPEDEDQLARELEIWGPEESREDENEATHGSHSSSKAAADARAKAAGVHSAAALFRRPSKASKKYTRPPMSKLFTSLELTAEEFLHLQAGAKAYMLDEAYPERDSCVGSRGKENTDMVKLKLYECVKAFLEEGWADRYFSSATLENGQPRKLRWPLMKTKIISLVTPLLRRMVTNERQRLYALESRQEKRIIGQDTTRQRAQASETPGVASPQPEIIDLRGETPVAYDPSLDPGLGNLRFLIESPFKSSAPSLPPPMPDFSSLAGRKDDVRFHVNLVQDGRRVKPRVTLDPSSCRGFSNLMQHILNLMNSGGQTMRTIKVLGPEGLLDVGDEESWNIAVSAVRENVWMDGDCKVVVQVEEGN